MKILLSSLSENTMKQYNSIFKKWWSFCNVNNLDMYRPSENNFINFLTEVFNSNAGFSTINTCRSAVNLICVPQIKQDVVSRFVKGVFRLRPSFPKYSSTWDPAIVLRYLSGLYPLESLNLEQLTLKTVTLLALVTAQRVQTLSKIDIKQINTVGDRLEILITEMLKTSAPKRHQPRLSIPFFDKPEICVASTIQFYINKTQAMRTQDYLFITHKKPFHTASSQTLSRWIKTCLRNSGVDTQLQSFNKTCFGVSGQEIRVIN